MGYGGGAGSEGDGGEIARCEFLIFKELQLYAKFREGKGGAEWNSGGGICGIRGITGLFERKRNQRLRVGREWRSKGVARLNAKVRDGLEAAGRGAVRIFIF